MASTATALRTLQRFVGNEEADPRIAQLIFCAPVLFDVALQFLSGGPDDEPLAYSAGIGLIAGATVLALLVGARRVNLELTIVIPAVDIVAVAALRAEPGTAIAFTLIIPAMWLGLQFGFRGLALAAALTTGFLVVAALWMSGLTLDTISRAVQAFVAVNGSSAVCALTAEMWRQAHATSVDALARVEQEAARAELARQVNEAIVQSVAVGLVALDAQGNVESMNPKVQEFMDIAYPKGVTAVDDNTGFLFGADGVTKLAQSEQPTVRALQGLAFRDQLIWIGPDPQSRRALAVSASPILDQSGAFAGSVLAYLEVTDLMVAARLKDEFVASVSHELRTPLTSIIGYLDLLNEGVYDVPADAREFLETVSRNARRLHRLVDDLLSTTFSSVAATLEFETVSLTRVVERAVAEAGTAAEGAGLTIVFDGDHPALSLEGDAERLAQVFDNLISNAIKYSDQGGEVEVRCARDDDEAVVSVTDHGRGIPAKDIDHVFDKFFRSASVQAEAIQGVGLGLAISKSIVSAHGGSISVTSSPAEGTTFEVRLPLRRPESLAASA